MLTPLSIMLTPRFRGALLLPASGTLVASSWRGHVQAGLGLVESAIAELKQHGALLSEEDLEVTKEDLQVTSVSSQGVVSQASTSRATAMQVLQAKCFSVCFQFAFDRLSTGELPVDTFRCVRKRVKGPPFHREGASCCFDGGSCCWRLMLFCLAGSSRCNDAAAIPGAQATGAQTIAKFAFPSSA